MSNQDRKIGFYGIQFKQYGKKDGDIFFDQEIFKNLLEFIDRLSAAEKVIKLERYKKAISIDQINVDSKKKGYLAKIVFKSCKYDHNPKYMSSIDGSERESDKKKYEGEKEKTHLCIQINALEGKAVLEERRSGVTIKGIVDYFEQNLKKYLEKEEQKKSYKIIHSIIPGHDFIEALKGMKEAKIAEIYTSKKFLGSEGYNLLEREDTFMKDDIVITTKAKPKLSLGKRYLKKAYESVVSGDGKISRVRVYGINSENNAVKIDSDVIKKLDYVKAVLDVDGTVNTKSVFLQMTKVLEADDE
jgi:hypothetical protein